MGALPFATATVARLRTSGGDVIGGHYRRRHCRHVRIESRDADQIPHCVERLAHPLRPSPRRALPPARGHRESHALAVVVHKGDVVCGNPRTEVLMERVLRSGRGERQTLLDFPAESLDAVITNKPGREDAQELAAAGSPRGFFLKKIVRRGSRCPLLPRPVLTGAIC